MNLHSNIGHIPVIKAVPRLLSQSDPRTQSSLSWWWGSHTASWSDHNVWQLFFSQWIPSPPLNNISSTMKICVCSRSGQSSLPYWSKSPQSLLTSPCFCPCILSQSVLNKVAKITHQIMSPLSSKPPIASHLTLSKTLQEHTRSDLAEPNHPILWLVLPLPWDHLCFFSTAALSSLPLPGPSARNSLPQLLFQVPAELSPPQWGLPWAPCIELQPTPTCPEVLHSRYPSSCLSR